MPNANLTAPIPDFNNTEIAFKSKSNADLKNSYWLFKAIGINWLVKFGPAIVNTAFALKLPVTTLIKKTVFKQFCGGESIDDCKKSIDLLYQHNVGTILDYSVEGKESDAEFNKTTDEIITTVKKAAEQPHKIPFCVFKVTGLASFALLQKISSGQKLNTEDIIQYQSLEKRISQICFTAFSFKVRLLIDAEESWIQPAIDEIAEKMMAEYNRDMAIIYNTIQLYRHDRLMFIKQSFAKAKQNNYKLGLKLVRGAYMEKERERAKIMGYTDPIQLDKAASDRDFNLALEYCIQHIESISICAGTHNEDSSKLLTELMQKNNISKNDDRVYFSQLFGMSDNLSFNLANAGYKVAKYLPYGPVNSVLPYLFRRAQENTSAAGQAGRELTLITKELNRRKHKQ